MMKKNHSSPKPSSISSTTASTIKKTEDSRRRFIKGLSSVLGGAAVGSLLTSHSVAVAMSFVPNEDSHLINGKIFKKAQLTLLKHICAIVIPKTDTLGAAEVDTHGFIDNQLFHCYPKAEQESAVNLLTLVNKTAKHSYSKPFISLNDEQKFTLLTELDLGEKRFDQTQRQHFKQLKQLICIGYYTSEVGATQELRYDPVPGGFKGSIPYNESDPVWATRALYI